MHREQTRTVTRRSQKGPASRARLGTRLGMAFLLVILVSLSVAYLSLDSARKVSADIEALISVRLPELRIISVLQQYSNQRALDLYRYYASAERGQAATARRDFSDEFRAYLSGLQAQWPRTPSIDDVLAIVAHYERHERAFEDEMRKGVERDWALLRAHLARAQTALDKVDDALYSWERNIKARTEAEGRKTLTEVRDQNKRQMAFSVGVLGVAVFLLVSMFSRLRDQAELYRYAYLDQLTGLPNRRSLALAWDDELRRLPSTGRLALLMVRLDRFQLVTGTFGHEVGDELLKKVSESIEARVESCSADTRLFKFDAVTWLVFVEEHPEQQLSLTLADKLFSLSGAPVQVDEYELNATLRIGVTYCPEHGKSLKSLLRNADAAQRVVAGDGHRRWRIYAPAMNEEAERLLSVESALRKALYRNELELHYQPKIDARSGAVVGGEALVRWNDNGKPISPGIFIPIAERTALIVPLGNWVLNRACRQWRQWQDEGMPPLPIAVNISAQQFQAAGFVDTVREALSNNQMPATMLELEITEEMATQNAELTIATLHELKQVGVTLAVDDFGTGYSSLSYLKRFPLDVLKVDASFVRQMSSSRQDVAIVRMLMTLGHELSFTIVAEGVETEQQYLKLKQMGCDLIQGFYFSRPLTADNFRNFVDEPAGVAEKTA